MDEDGMKFAILLLLIAVYAQTEADMEWKADYGLYRIAYPYYRRIESLSVPRTIYRHFEYQPLQRALYRQLEYPLSPSGVLVRSYNPEYFYRRYGFYP
ncbi:hypothetical protein SFRURICE_004240 [Spodoptera frugiperda]|nr:hypothetical protein SFRURICE_004240 [Spodoptera frugiperda]